MKSTSVSQMTSKVAQSSNESGEGQTEFIPVVQYLSILLLIWNFNLLANYTPELTKLIKIGQNNAFKLNNVITKQQDLEKKVDEQGAQIAEILSLLKDREKTDLEIKKSKTKNKTKNTDEFYLVNIIIYTVYYFTISLHYLYSFIITCIIGRSKEARLRNFSRAHNFKWTWDEGAHKRKVRRRRILCKNSPEVRTKRCEFWWIME